MYRKEALAVGKVYHIFNKSISGFKIFNNDSKFLRMLSIIRYYQTKSPPLKFSRFVKLNKSQKDLIAKSFYNISSNSEKLVEIIAYCIMPTHLHFILKQVQDKGISIFMNRILSSHTLYFNKLHNRKGPLWEGRFKNVLVNSDEQLLHLTRYVHLNPVTAYLVNSPEDWHTSSYKEYISKNKETLCEYDKLLDIETNSYAKFCKDRISYQRELKKIKDLILE